MKPDFSKIEFEPLPAPASAVPADDQPAAWVTPEQIPIKPWYTADDLHAMEHLEYAAGVAPYLRGPYTTMYALQPWSCGLPASVRGLFDWLRSRMRSTGATSAAGQKGLSVAF